MTWLWLTCFSLLLAWPAAAADVIGTVRISDSLRPAARSGRDSSGVVLWLEPTGPAAARSPASPRHFQMLQKDKRFVPHLLVVPMGSAVDFPNLDPIFHSAFSNFSGQVFDFGLYPPGTSRTVAFTRPGVVRVFCNIHAAMSAVIVVVQSPWFALSDRAGGFAIHGVPPGEYRLHVFHERSSEETLHALDRGVTVADRNLSLPPLTVSEIGYLEEPHRNKYGHDYPPAADDVGAYAPGRK